MTPEIKDIFTVTLTLVSLLANLWMFFTMRRLEQQKASEKRLGDLEKDVADKHAKHAERLVALEQGGFSKEDRRKLYERIDTLTQSVAGLAGEFHAAQHTLAMIQQYLMGDGK
jgi:hypothetical protein